VFQKLSVEPVCPRCLSDDVSKIKLSRVGFALGLLLLGFPLPFLSNKYHCHNCGNEFKHAGKAIQADDSERLGENESD
jgi:transposase-like protein